ncbi:MAG: hypothetical protein ACJASX_001763 [Limisphaerales bacterium]
MLTPIDRRENLRQAEANRQSVFAGDCAAGHVQPTRNKLGHELYRAACGICPDSPHRTTMVPDLNEPKLKFTPDQWQELISNGRANTLMPAFHSRPGGH